MMESRELKQIMRLMAWQRAKGELRSLLITFSGTSYAFDYNYTMEKFIKEIEDEGYLD